MRLSEQLLIDHNCGDFGQALKGYYRRAKDLEDIVEAVANIGVDTGYGEFQLNQEHIDFARKLLTPDLTNNSDGE